MYFLFLGRDCIGIGISIGLHENDGRTGDAVFRHSNYLQSKIALVYRVFTGHVERSTRKVQFFDLSLTLSFRILRPENAIGVIAIFLTRGDRNSISYVI